MDLSVPRMDGIEATRLIKEHLPKTSVLILSGRAEEDLLMEAVRALSLRCPGAGGDAVDEPGPMLYLSQETHHESRGR